MDREIKNIWIVFNLFTIWGTIGYLKCMSNPDYLYANDYLPPFWMFISFGGFLIVNAIYLFFLILYFLNKEK